MRKWLPVAFLILGLPLNSAGQIIPNAAVFGGYTYVHASHNGGGSGFSLNGWAGSLEVKPASWLGMVADVSRQYASPNGIRENQTSVLFGPQVSVPGIPRIIPFAHAMAGIVHGTNLAIPLGIPCSSTGPCYNYSIATGNAFATAVGGGVDIQLRGPIWIRAVQADWLHGNLGPDHHTQARLATGIVLRFGR
jgi:hypothetical protein